MDSNASNITAEKLMALSNSNMMNLWKKSICHFVRNNNNISDMTDDSIVVNYLTYIRKCVPYPVTVYESNEIKNMISDEIKGPYNKIKKRLSSGEGVAPYLSNRATRLEFDGLYLDWNILHLHLGDLDNESSTAKRTGKTLHLMVAANKAYLIKIGQHGSGAYTDLAELKIIHNNWPDLLSVLNGIRSSTITSKDRIKMRNRGINVATAFTDNDGNLLTIAPKNHLGYSAAKTSVRDTELLLTIIPGLINGIVEHAKSHSNKANLFSEGKFYYYPQEMRFIFGSIDSQENLSPLFEFSSTDLWKGIFSSDAPRINITIFS